MLHCEFPSARLRWVERIWKHAIVCYLQASAARLKHACKNTTEALQRAPLEYFKFDLVFPMLCKGPIPP